MRLLPSSSAPLALVRALKNYSGAAQEYRWMQDHARKHPGVNLAEMIHRRVHGEPLQYILGSQPFGPLDIRVRPPVLIPRPETEEWAISLCSVFPKAHGRPLSVLDLCTGTGCIPLLLCALAEKGTLRAVGVDISEDAVALARENAALCMPHFTSANADKEGKQNTFTAIKADLFSDSIVELLRPQSSGEHFDVLTANPPYIAPSAADTLPPSVRDWEDSRALFAPEDGFAFYRRIAKLANPAYGLVRPGALIALEVGAAWQAEKLKGLLKDGAAAREVKVWKDLWGKERAVVAGDSVPDLSGYHTSRNLHS